MEKGEFEIIVRGLVIKDRKILVCQNEGRDYFYLPGGHVEFGESLKKALDREFIEETGIGVKSSEFIGTVENIFLQDERQSHEMNFVFVVELDGEVGEPAEDHLKFRWLNGYELTDEKFVPPALRNAILKWMAEKKTFFIMSEEEINLHLN